MLANAVAKRAPASPMPALYAVIATAWLWCLWVELSGNASRLHHHALYESAQPFWISALLVLGAWQAMTAAMMLPSSLGFMRTYAATAANAPDFPRAFALLLAAYFGVWTLFGLGAFAGDMQLHRLVDAWPWLASHAGIIPAITLGVAAIYELTPLKDACLKACRHPAIYLVHHYRRGALNGFRLGLRHALFCLGCCWALMLVMFAAGVAHLAWMGVLAAIMLVEKTTPAGERVVPFVGAALALLAPVALFVPNVFGSP